MLVLDTDHLVELDRASAEGLALQERLAAANDDAATTMFLVTAKRLVVDEHWSSAITTRAPKVGYLGMSLADAAQGSLATRLAESDSTSMYAALD